MSQQPDRNSNDKTQGSGSHQPGATPDQQKKQQQQQQPMPGQGGQGGETTQKPDNDRDDTVSREQRAPGRDGRK